MCMCVYDDTIVGLNLSLPQKFALRCISSMYTAQMVPPAVCARLPVSASLPGTGGVPGLPHARHWLPMLQEELY